MVRKEQISRFESIVRDPCLRFVTEAAEPLHNISAQIVADPRPNGGSLFRIYRDIRFSENKQPYKTHIGIQFRHLPKRKTYTHRASTFTSSPANIFSLEVVEARIQELNSIRQAIVAKPEHGQRLRRRCRSTEKLLSRPPRGFAADHPLIEDLKRKDFIALVGVFGGAGVRPEVHEGFHQSVPADQPAG